MNEVRQVDYKEKEEKERRESKESLVYMISTLRERNEKVEEIYQDRIRDLLEKNFELRKSFEMLKSNILKLEEENRKLIKELEEYREQIRLECEQSQGEDI